MQNDITIRKKAFGGFDTEQVDSYLSQLKSECDRAASKADIIAKKREIAELEEILEKKNAQLEKLKKIADRIQNESDGKNSGFNALTLSTRKIMDAQKDVIKITDDMSKYARKADKSINPLFDNLSDITDTVEKVGKSLADLLEQYNKIPVEKYEPTSSPVRSDNSDKKEESGNEDAKEADDTDIIESFPDIPAAAEILPFKDTDDDETEDDDSESDAADAKSLYEAERAKMMDAESDTEEDSDETPVPDSENTDTVENILEDIDELLESEEISELNELKQETDRKLLEQIGVSAPKPSEEDSEEPTEESSGDESEADLSDASEETEEEKADEPTEPNEPDESAESDEPDEPDEPAAEEDTADDTAEEKPEEKKPDTPPSVNDSYFTLDY